MGVTNCCVEAESKPEKHLEGEQYIPSGQLDTISTKRFDQLDISLVNKNPNFNSARSTNSKRITRSKTDSVTTGKQAVRRRNVPMSTSTGGITMSKKQLDAAYRDGVYRAAQEEEQKKYSNIPTNYIDKKSGG